MSFWRVISEAQSLRTEFLRTTTTFKQSRQRKCKRSAGLLAYWTLVDPRGKPQPR
jgi:hypothetical protein